MEASRLERRPEARAFSVETLLQLVREGKIRVPDFQRPLRWRANHVLDLFDSVYRGFPVGDLLFFKRPAPAATLYFGAAHVHAPDASDAHFVVDGQQRITALAAAMLHPEPQPHGDIYAVWFDLESERFARARGATMPASWIPLNVVGDSIALLNWLHDWPFRGQRPDLVQRAIALGKALREYQIPAYIVDGASDEVLRLIFKRVNTSGVRMTESDVFGALFRGGEPHPVESACARLQTTTGFGNVLEHWFLRCLKAVEGFDITRPLTEGQVARLDARAVERTEEALLRVIRFLEDDAGVIHLDLLPFPTPLVVLARFFHLHARPAQRTRELLSRWVWRGALTDAHIDFSDGTLQHTSRLVDGDEIASVERLLHSIDSMAFSPLESQLDEPFLASMEWEVGWGSSRLAVLALAHLGPRDPESGEALSDDEVRALLEEKSIGEIFLDVEGLPGSIVARRVLVATPDQVEKLAAASPEVLQSHGIDEEAALALARGDIAAFAERRERILDDLFKPFFAAQLGLDDGDRPPVDEIVRRVDKVLAAE